MKIIESITEMQKLSQEMRLKGQSIGFVPTMGFLHEGHLTLINNARKENDVVVVSIFVNPLQFGPNEDFGSYPRDIERDQKLAQNAGVDVLFNPSTDGMYRGATMSASIQVKERVDVLCGKKREGHFDGVATVVSKLFNIVLPHRAYFGMKDAQQVAVIHGLIEDFNIPVQLVPIETIREEDGLAKSSRNVYLSSQERNEAPVLYKSLVRGKQAIEEGERDPEKIKSMIIENITSETTAKIDYVDIYSYPELKPLTVISGKVIIALAIKFTKARLIDNISFDV